MGTGWAQALGTGSVHCCAHAPRSRERKTKFLGQYLLVGTGRMELGIGPKKIAQGQEEAGEAIKKIMFLEGVDPSTRTTRWNLLTEDWLVSGSDTLERVLQKKKKLMANAGNVNARNATDDEVMENNVTIQDLYKLPAGSPFWLLDLRQDFPARMPLVIKSPNPKHQGAPFPVHQLKYGMVQSRVAKAGKERVYDIDCPADRPPLDWNIEIVGKHSKTLSRAEVGGSVFVLCAVKKKK